MAAVRPIQARPTRQPDTCMFTVLSLSPALLWRMGRRGASDRFQAMTSCSSAKSGWEVAGLKLSRMHVHTHTVSLQDISRSFCPFTMFWIIIHWGQSSAGMQEYHASYIAKRKDRENAVNRKMSRLKNSRSILNFNIHIKVPLIMLGTWGWKGEGESSATTVCVLVFFQRTATKMLKTVLQFILQLQHSAFFK